MDLPIIGRSRAVLQFSGCVGPCDQGTSRAATLETTRAGWIRMPRRAGRFRDYCARRRGVFRGRSGQSHEWRLQTICDGWPENAYSAASRWLWRWIRAASSGRQEPQFVPAPSTSPRPERWAHLFCDGFAGSCSVRHSGRHRPWGRGRPDQPPGRPARAPACLAQQGRNVARASRTGSRATKTAPCNRPPWAKAKRCVPRAGSDRLTAALRRRTGAWPKRPNRPGRMPLPVPVAPHPQPGPWPSSRKRASDPGATRQSHTRRRQRAGSRPGRTCWPAGPRPDRSPPRPAHRPGRWGRFRPSSASAQRVAGGDTASLISTRRMARPCGLVTSASVAGARPRRAASAGWISR
jgi:hypothetical protein